MSKQDKTISENNDSPPMINDSDIIEKRPVGRPSKYNAELLKKAKNYLFVYKGLDEVCPTLEGLARYIDINSDTLYTWIKDEDKKDFSDTVKQVTRAQKITLINKGLSGDFTSKIAQLLLGANHSVIEKQSTEISGPGGKPQEHSWKIEFVEAKKEDK